MGAERNKVLLDLAGEPVLRHTLRHLARSRRIDELVVVCREEDEAEFRAIAAAEAALPPVRFARGGKERDDSVAAGIAATNPTAGVILIHDAARPFVARRLVAAVVDAASRHGAAIPVVPIADTVKRVANERVLATVDRSALAGAQTPQGFLAGELRAVRARTRPKGSPTDDSAWFELDGRAVAAVAGDPWNIKLTTPDDLALAPALLRSFCEREARREQEDRK